MSKKRFFTYAISLVVISLLANVFVGRWLSAKISTLPVLNRFKILSPQAPIVITNQQVVRTSDSTDALEAASSAKSKLSAVAAVDANGSVTQVGSAVNVTSDGVFVTGLPTFSLVGAKYFVVLSDGTTGAIASTTVDSATGLVFFKASVSGVSPAALASSQNLVVGQKVLFLANTLQSFSPHFLASFVTQLQSDVYGQTFDADKPSRSFGVQAAGPLLSGQAVVNLSGDVAGIWNGSEVISSDVLRQSMSPYLANPAKIVRPAFGFTYLVITKPQSQLSGLPTGALVRTVQKNKEFSSQLLPNDIITSVDGNAISDNSSLEVALQNLKVGDTTQLKVYRNKQTSSLAVKIQ